MYDLYGKKLYLTKNYRLFDFIGFSLIFYVLFKNLTKAVLLY